MDQNLLHYLKTFLTPSRLALFDTILDKRTKHFTVATEDVYQLHNTSAVMRTCDIFGIQDMHVVEEKYGKRVDKEIAMGAQKWVSLTRHASINDCIAKIKSQGYQIVATVPSATATVLHEFDVHKKSAFFFGTEKAGLSETVLQQADAMLTIPMYGFTSSLNISVSAAIIVQHMVAKLKQTDIAWQLTPAEKEEVLLQWCKSSIKNSNEIIARYHNSTSSS